MLDDDPNSRAAYKFVALWEEVWERWDNPSEELVVRDGFNVRTEIPQDDGHLVYNSPKSISLAWRYRVRKSSEVQNASV